MPRKRVGGSTMKTAKVWRFFDELPTPEQAAECRLCRKKIKATNSRSSAAKELIPDPCPGFLKV
ncbi:hypothetical protein ANCDUO_22610 [Ancylostoma duodenale]|uniref:BED-type domain-containing protein n=1 Tax=Ancylostoma duodenale TaxID=51022 RepID=A0A0C2CBW5_9BILA|nr:hypothetical protein ANCDUO_22610 [Ancylostoma duodenale]